MSVGRRVVLGLCLVVPLVAMLSMGCGLFALPVAGPKALVINAKRIHFTVDITDSDGTPLPAVEVEVRRLSDDVNILFGEVEKSDNMTRTVDGHLVFDEFGQYAVELRISKSGYGTVSLLCANSDKVDRLPGPFMSARMPIDEKVVNVEKYPEQHVVLSPVPPGMGR